MNRAESIVGKYFNSKIRRAPRFTRSVQRKSGARALIFAAIVPVAALAFLLLQAVPAVAAPPKHLAAKPSLAEQTAAADPDKTLAAMQDELDRSRQRLELKIPARTIRRAPTMFSTEYSI